MAERYSSLLSMPPNQLDSDPALVLDVTVFWGSTVLAVKRLDPPRRFSVGPDRGDVELVLPDALTGGVPRALCEVQGEAVLISSLYGSPRRLTPGQEVEVELGPLSFRFGLGPRERHAFRKRALDWGDVGYFSASLAVVGSLLGALAFFAPPLGITLDEGLDRERQDLMLQYLSASAERELVDPRSDGPGSRSAPPEGSPERPGELGRPEAPRRVAHFASSAPRDDQDTTRSRDQILAEARSFGLIGILASASPSNPGSLWERDGALSPLDSTVMGGLFGVDIGEVAGSGGVGPSGTGQGSGTPGRGVGLGGIGGCAADVGCRGPGVGFGASAGLGSGGGRTTKAPRLRAQGTTEVSGALPAEVIQRVVRQNFGRFRLCYENGLRKNPTLTGRVAARFVIDRTGAVSAVQNGDSDLPDSAVVACVVSTFYGLSFPAPERGVVRVTYPIVFSVG